MRIKPLMCHLHSLSICSQIMPSYFSLNLLVCVCVAYEVKIVTADKKSAGTSNSLYLVIVAQDASKTYHFKNSSRAPRFQRGQTDTFQVATPPMGMPTSVKVAHCPRKTTREDVSKSSWHLFQIVLTCLASRNKYYFSCRKWVESSQSSDHLNFTEISLSKTEHL